MTPAGLHDDAGSAPSSTIPVGATRLRKVEQLLHANRPRKRPGAPLAARLRAVREERGLSGTQVAELTGIAQPRISKIETGQLLPSLDELRAYLNACEVPPHLETKILSLAESATLDEFPRTLKTIGHLELDVVQRQWLAAERASDEIRVFHHSLIPGLLQIKPYAEAALAQGNFSNRSDLDHALGLRMNRTAELDELDKSFYFVLTESALRTSLGLSADVLTRQLERMKDLMRHSNIHIAIVPLDHMTFVAMDNFHVMDNDLVSIENFAVEVLTDHPSYVKVYRELFDRAIDAAGGNARAGRMPDEEKAVALIDSAIERFKSRPERSEAPVLAGV